MKMNYRSCFVPFCTNNSIKTPEKLFIFVPSNLERRLIWLKLARLKPDALLKNKNIFFCEDHFDLPNVMENYMQYKLMGSVVRIRMKANSRPSKFDCHINKEHLLPPIELSSPFIKQEQYLNIKEENLDIKLEDPVIFHDDKSIQVNIVPYFRSKYVQTESVEIERNNDIEIQSYKLCCGENKITSCSRQERMKTEEQCIQLQQTIKKIMKRPSVYIGISKEICVFIDVLQAKTNIVDHHILLCLMKLRLNRTFSELADDFGVTAAVAMRYFLKYLPVIAVTLQPFISKSTPNSTIVIRQLSYNAICLIDCLEIIIQKPKIQQNQIITWSNLLNAHTIKYLLAYTIQNGLVSFVSCGYGGRINNIDLLKQCQLLDSLEPGGCILASDKFVNIEYDMRHDDFTFITVPKIKQTSYLRSHIKKIVGRIREFHMFKARSILNIQYIDILDCCVTTACALINLQESPNTVLNTHIL